MPSTTNSHLPRIKTALDTEVCQKIITLERDFYRYADKALPKKHKYTLVSACIRRMMEARDIVVEAMDYDITHYAAEKHRLLSVARARMRNVAVDIQHLNDLGDVSNEAKAHFDEQMDAVQTHIARLLNSLSRKMDAASENCGGTPTQDV